MRAERHPYETRYYGTRDGRYVPNRVTFSSRNLIKTFNIWKIRLHRFWVLTQTLVRDSLTPMSAVKVAPGRWMSGVLMATGIGMIVYFSYHTVAGNHGLFALVDLRERRDALSAELALIRDRRVRFERQVDLLDRRRLDPDILEESARATLGYAHPDDLVIFRPGR